VMRAQPKRPMLDTGVEVVSPLVETLEIELPANATSAAFSDDGTTCAVAMGDGGLALLDVSCLDVFAAAVRPTPADIEAKFVQLHSVATVGVRAIKDEFISIGQDGRAVIFEAGAPERANLLYSFPNAWIQDVAVSESSGLIALAVRTPLRRRRTKRKAVD